MKSRLPCPDVTHMLIDMEKTISMAELTRNAERIAKDIETAGTVYRVERPGHRSMLLIDLDYFDGRIAALEFMQMHPNWREEIEEGRREFREGKCIPLDLALRELGLDEPSPKTKRAKATRRSARARRTKSR